MRQKLTSLVSWLGLFGITLFYPIQNWQTFKTGNTVGLSLPAFCVLLVGTLAFAALGVLTKNKQLAAANAIGSGFTGTLIYMMVR